MTSLALRLALLAASTVLAPQAAALQASLPFLEITDVPGWESIGYCASTQMSANGRYLVFSCIGDPSFVLAKSDPPRETVLLDRLARRLEWISTGRDGEGNATQYGNSGYPSDDGRLVLFNSPAALHPDVEPTPPELGRDNAYLRDRQAQQTVLVGRDAAGNAIRPWGARVAAAAMSRQLMVLTARDNLVDSRPLPDGADHQIYVRNWISGEVDLITATTDGGFNTAPAYSPAISPDGRYVSFLGDPQALGLSTSPVGRQLLLRDRHARSTRRLSWAGGGQEFGPGGYYQLEAGNFSRDGRYLVASASGDGLEAAGASGLLDVYVIDVQKGRYELVSYGHGGQPADGGSFSAKLSGDGRYVAFFSFASNLLATPQRPSVYVRDRYTGQLLNLSATLPEPRANFSTEIQMSADGSTVTFNWQLEPDPPYFSSPVDLYSVTLRGDPPPLPRAIPVLDTAGRLLLAALLAVLGLWACRQLPRSKRV